LQKKEEERKKKELAMKVSDKPFYLGMD